MKMTASVFSLVIFCLAYGTAEGVLRKAELKVPGIECATAEIKAADAASSVEGVTDAAGDMINNSLAVTFDDQKPDIINEIRNALREAGYPAEGEPRYLE
jgi:cation transport ATPase